MMKNVMFDGLLTVQTITAIANLFRQPAIPYEPAKHSLKGWAKYCLQSQGYKVVYAERADFAVESRDRKKLYFKVSDRPQPPEPNFAWIVWDGTSQTASIIAPAAESI